MPLTALCEPTSLPPDQRVYPLYPLATSDTPPSAIAATGFRGKVGEVRCAVSPTGELEGAYIGCGDNSDPWAMAAGLETLPEGVWRLASCPEGNCENFIALAWALATYRFARYRAAVTPPQARLLWPEAANRSAVTRTVEAVERVRDMVNTPAEDMGPEQIEAAVRDMAARHRAEVHVITGDDLLGEGILPFTL